MVGSETMSEARAEIVFTGGAQYAREVAWELGLEHCFVAFLPKPTIMLDDQAPAEWRLCRHVHPFNVDSIET
jgi:hypothetical protein